jgi:hypothetical protein
MFRIFADNPQVRQTTCSVFLSTLGILGEHLDRIEPLSAVTTEANPLAHVAILAGLDHPPIAASAARTLPAFAGALRGELR